MTTTKNANLSAAKKAKNDEFYTQYHDIEKEMNAYLDFDENVFRDKTILLPCDDPEWSNFTKFFAQNFTRLGLKKLISTSFAHQSKQLNTPYQPSLFESETEGFDEQKSLQRGKIFTLSEDTNADGVIDVQDLKWQYLQGDGDFRSAEIKQLRDEADIIITNPPFSLFREFMAWIMEAEKKFAVIGNMNAITYKEIFPLIKENKMWLGNGFQAGNAFFATLIQKDYADGVFDSETGLVKFRNCSWFTNLEHGRRHQPLQLMTMNDNRKFNKQVMNNANAYQPYDNYNAIEVPFTNAIPSDFDGVMGVPISFLDKYNPEQFEIVGMCENEDLYHLKTKVYTSQEKTDAYFAKFGKKGNYDLNASAVLNVQNRLEKVYQRILIRHKTRASK
ncbi:hypothetical protein GVX76_02410 [[Haemophilus] felis]|nr:hypothetical protein [[Haemophilus] felis]